MTAAVRIDDPQFDGVDDEVPRPRVVTSAPSRAAAVAPPRTTGFVKGGKEVEDAVRTFIRQLAERGGVGRCYWTTALWPAEYAGLVRTRFVPRRTPPHRLRLTRDWCYEVSFTEKGQALADELLAAERTAAAPEGSQP